MIETAPNVAVGNPQDLTSGHSIGGAGPLSNPPGFVPVGDRPGFILDSACHPVENGARFEE